LASPPVRPVFIVIILSMIVLGLIWVAIFLSLPKPEEMTAVDDPQLLPQPSPQPPPTQLPPPPAQSFQVPSPKTPAKTPPIVKKPPRRSTSTPKEPFQPAPGSVPQPASQRPRSSPTDEDTLVSQGMSPNCMAELEKLCPGNQSGNARKKCFQDNEGKLSSACRQQLDAMAFRIKEDMQNFKVACEADVRRLCRNVEPGAGRILQCLEENYQDVSNSCYQALRTRPFRK
jgi:hypothetical protein